MTEVEVKVIDLPRGCGIPSDYTGLAHRLGVSERGLPWAVCVSGRIEYFYSSRELAVIHLRAKLELIKAWVEKGG